MRTKILIPTLVSSLILLPSVFGQGSLTPPGAPAPTMKSLNQIEPRTPISSLPFTITNAGSYYLTTNLYTSSAAGIIISANNVTLNLNGFALTGTPSGSGIIFSASQTNFTVCNGSLAGWEVAVEVDYGNSCNVVLERLAISGCSYVGIYAYCPVLVRNCVFAGISTTGVVLENGGQITDCDISNSGARGIYALNAVVRNCRVVNSGTEGIYVAPGMVTGCWVQTNFWSGIFVDGAGSQIFGNTCIANNTRAMAGDAGIYINNRNNRIEDNHVSASGYAGICVSSGSGWTNNIIVRNSVSGNGTNNYVTPGSQIVGPLITTSGIITNSNPWANFSY